jgi:carbonic anhydrase
MQKPTFIFQSLILGCAILFTTGCSSNQSKPKEEPAETRDTVKANEPASARPVHWSYEGESGPATWGNLSPVYAFCKDGRHQSPVDIVKTAVKENPDWAMNYSTTSMHITHTEHMEDIVDNGHTIQVNVDDGNTMTYGDKTYTLKQFHFHTPSEHTINGQHQPMEMHMVHQTEDGNLAVVSVLFKEGKSPNPVFTKLVENLPNTKGESKHVADAHLELDLHLPKDNSAYHYTGSLTTPPCSENVQWVVLREMLTLSRDQIEAFSSRIGPNNRPVQPLNDRLIDGDDLKVKSN